jgi:CubicO group peptidase (beta-lactamase class C family)
MPNALRSAVAALLLLSLGTGCAPDSGPETPYTPDSTWETVDDRTAEEWSPDRLQAARAYSDSIGSAAVIIVHEGRIVDEWGAVQRTFKCHSIRKSFLSALYGISVQRGTIDPSATMGGLGIDDRNPLTEQEKAATVRMLLKARSGIYHDALYETPAMEAARPERGSHAPGTHWYYNNWDFNALGTIYEQETGTKIHQAFEDRIAEPIGMQSFQASDGSYVEGEDSIHPAYPFQMTARDLARFGLLYLRDGIWDGTQVVPEFWVKESTVSYSDAGEAGGYGYLWWVSVDGQHFEGVDGVPHGTYTARGAGGHTLVLVPDLDLALVHRVNTFEDRDIPYGRVGTLLKKVLAAKDDWAGSPNY